MHDYCEWLTPEHWQRIRDKQTVRLGRIRNFGKPPRRGEAFIFYDSVSPLGTRTFIYPSVRRYSMSSVSHQVGAKRK